MRSLHFQVGSGDIYFQRMFPHFPTDLGRRVSESPGNSATLLLSVPLAIRKLYLFALLPLEYVARRHVNVRIVSSCNARACELFRSLACRTYSLKITILNIDDSSIMAMNHGHAFIQFVLCAFSVACQMAVIFLMPGRVTSNHTRLGIGHFSHLLFSFCLCHCRSSRGHSPLMKSPL